MQTEDMMFHRPPGMMLAILQEEDTTCAHDETLDYLFLLHFKLALNTMVLFYWTPSVTKSLIGLFSISMYVVDVILICALCWAWWIRHTIDLHEVLCFLLSHSSTVYSLLPLPILMAGTVDCVSSRNLDILYNFAGKTVCRCIIVLLVWTLACLYSYCSTNTEVFMIFLQQDFTALTCHVQGSAIVSHFTTNLLILVAFILLLHYKKLPRWCRLARRISMDNADFYIPTTDLTFSRKLEGLKEPPFNNLQDRPPLFISLTMCFALSWTPYLLTSVICELLEFTIPSYASVNLLWTACANSLVVGIRIWHTSYKHIPLYSLPDEVCSWTTYWRLSKEHKGLAASTKKMENLLIV